MEKLTVGELRKQLENYSDDTVIIKRYELNDFQLSTIRDSDYTQMKKETSSGYIYWDGAKELITLPHPIYDYATIVIN